MKKIIGKKVGVVALFVLCGLGESSVIANERYIVNIKSSSQAREEVTKAIGISGGRILHSYNIISALAVSLPENALEGIKNNPQISSIEPDLILSATAQPSGKTSQPPQTIEWGVNRIDADLAWETTKGAGINVAVIDTGIYKTHPDLIDNIKGGVNFIVQKGVVKASAWNDDNGHGTHVAGIIAAADNTIGVKGVAPMANLYGVKVLDRNGSGYLSDIIAGIEWAKNNNMQVINMSLGTNSYSQALETACNNAYAAGLILVAAAGNDGDTFLDSDVDYPGAFASVIAVAATDNYDRRAAWSSDGPEVEIAAPGVNIRSTWKGGGYNTISGTSMASPHLAGVVTLILTQPVSPGYDLNLDGRWNPEEVRKTLAETADDFDLPGRDSYFGFGLVDAEESVTGTQTLP